MPSLSVSAFNGSVPIASSTALVSPSPSVSPSAVKMFSVLLALGSWLDGPAALLATSAKEPTAAGATERVKTADLPSAAMLADVIETEGGLNAGANANVEPVRLSPVIRKLE